MAFQNGERKDLGGPCLPHSLQHCGGRSGKGGASGSLQAAGIAASVGMVDGGAQHSVLCRRRPHSGTQPHLGIDDSDISGQNV